MSTLTHAGAAGAEAGWRALLAAGANDFGGVSPLTKDYVNPEKPWPHVSALAAATAASGMPLVPRCRLPPALSLLACICAVSSAQHMAAFADMHSPRMLLKLLNLNPMQTPHCPHSSICCTQADSLPRESARQRALAGRQRRARAASIAAVMRAADGSGYARGSQWCPGLDPAAAPILLPEAPCDACRATAAEQQRHVSYAAGGGQCGI